jgi:hypothetical protein
MSIFREYLSDWEFDDRWRDFVLRLAEITEHATGQRRAVLEGCTIWNAPAKGGGPAGILIWADVVHPDRHVVAVTLAGLLDERGVRCGEVSSSRPGDLDIADLTWQQFAPPAEHPLSRLAESFADLAGDREPAAAP